MDNQKSKTPQKNRKSEAVGKAQLTKKLVSPTQKRFSSLQRCKNWLTTRNSEQLNDDRVEDIETELSSDSGDCKLELVETPEQRQEYAKIKHQVNMLCEWETCKAEFETYVSFKEHGAGHLEKLQPEIEGGEDGIYVCHWDLCMFNSVHAQELRIHFYYHLYHTYLKSFGERMLLTRKVPPCVLDSMRRNCIPEITSEYVCEWIDCECKFESICDFFEHTRQHCVFENAMSAPGTRTIKCNWAGCGKTFEKLARLTDHLRFHVHERKMACPQCGSSFMAYGKFYAHFKRQGVDKQYQCVHCFKSFFSEDILNAHKEVHVNRYKCTMCDMTCPSPSALALHIRHRHIADKPYKCGIRFCNFSSILKQDLDKHTLTSHEEHMYECDVFGCNFFTTSLYRMRKHHRSVHEKAVSVYCCHCCSSRFNKGNQLSNHLIKLHKFQLPSGHARFMYRRELDGYYRLQLMRLESLEVSQQIMSNKPNETVAPTLEDIGEFTVNNIEQTAQGHLNISVQRSEPNKCIAINEEVGSTYDEALSMPELQFSDDSNLERTSEAYLRRSTRKRKHVSNSVDQFKNIKEFSMMKRYLESVEQTQIMIEVNDVDEAGNVVKSQIISADEIHVQ